MTMAETASILLLHGTDELAISGHIEKACSALGDATTAGMNISRFDGRQELDRNAFHTAVNAAPFLAPRRLVVLSHPTAALANEQNKRQLLEILEKAPATTSVILVADEELKAGHWLLKWLAALQERGSVHLYRQPKTWEMIPWILSEARRLGGSIDQDAAGRLSALVGQDTRLAAQELLKLLTYVNYARPIRMADVEQVGIASAQNSIFELVDALGQRQGQKAQKILHRLLEDQDAMELWGMVIRQFRLLIQAREMLDEKASQVEVQENLALHPFVAQKVTYQARAFPMPALEAIYHRLLEIDRKAKTGQMPLDLSLDLLIVELL